MIPKIPVRERFFVSRVGSPEFCLFKCIVRYGYKDARQDSYTFENQLIEKVVEFLQNEIQDSSKIMESEGQVALVRHQLGQVVNEATQEPGNVVKTSRFFDATVNDEVDELLEAKQSGVTYMMGHTFVVAHSSSSLVKKFVINTVYGFLRRNSRHPAVTLGIPQSSLIEIGMVYHV
ncbi:Potassium transporter [Thalictrum thalictroides]|uniref:Potassium transporter n=1 Tax=Thalictrum thalictroides TaxID=46969 RepID=A0A7J6WZ62_THATH|nr:Potassium transporter [Thalictrum thalictroides]